MLSRIIVILSYKCSTINARCGIVRDKVDL